jgi:hypothetical protein
MKRPDLATLACVHAECQLFRCFGASNLVIRKVYGHDRRPPLARGRSTCPTVPRSARTRHHPAGAGIRRAIELREKKQKRCQSTGAISAIGGSFPSTRRRL